MRRLLLLLTLIPTALLAAGLTPQEKERAETIFREVRCPVCESQSLHDSNSPLAQDMRQLITRDIQSGKTDKEILQSLSGSYGEAILLEPKDSHILLWGFPFLILLGGIGAIIWHQRKNSSLRSS
jgi:cytochrome c-type biogenesis protein CcmH